MADCLFCKIVNKEIPAEIIAETDHYISFKDVNPQAPSHVLLIPKQHIESLEKLSDTTLAGELIVGARDVAEKLSLDQGYRVVTNIGKHGGQSVFHLHFHILGKRALAWPPG